MKICKSWNTEAKVDRATEGTLFELVCLLLILAAWGVNLWGIVRSSAAHPFDGGILIADAVATIVIAFILWQCYHHPEKVMGHPYLETDRQQLLGIRFARILAVECTLLFLLLSIHNAGIWDMHTILNIFKYVLLGSLLLSKFLLHRIK